MADRTSPPREPGDLTATLRGVLDGWAPRGWPPRITVAFSGGLDSTVLLAALRRLALPTRLRAAHVDHGLHSDSAAWSARCAATAARLGVELAAVRVTVDRSSRHGLEAAARDARYRALGELLAPGEWLLTAHHGDDQLETLLLRLMRGTGVRGLRGIRPFGPLAAGFIGRPLLGFTRAALRAQAVAWNLEWLEDPSNLELVHDRNYLRLRVLPALVERWPAAVQHAAGLAAQMSDAESLLDAVAAEDARALTVPWHLPRAVLAALPAARQRNLLRHVLRGAHLATPSARKLEELRSALLAARVGSGALVRWPSGEGRIFREALYLAAPLAPPSAPGYAARIARGAEWAGPEGRVALEPARGGDGLPESWLAEGLTLKFRAGGERFRPHGRRHHYTLKHLFQERGVVPWMRSRVPLLYRGAALVAIGDLWITADVDAAAADEPRWRVRWTEHPALFAP